MAEKTVLGKSRVLIRFTKDELLLLLRSYQAHPCSWIEIINTMKQNLNLLPAKTAGYYESMSRKTLQDRLTKKLGRLLTDKDIKDHDIRDEVENIKKIELKYMKKSQDTAPKMDHPKAKTVTITASTPNLDVEKSEYEVPDITPQPSTSKQSYVMPTVVIRSQNDSQDDDLPSLDEQFEFDVPIIKKSRISQSDIDLKRDQMTRQMVISGESDIDGHDLSDKIDENDQNINNTVPIQSTSKGKGKGKGKGKAVKAKQSPEKKLSTAQLIRENQLKYQKFMDRKLPKILHSFGVDADTESD